MAFLSLLLAYFDQIIPSEQTVMELIKQKKIKLVFNPLALCVILFSSQRAR